MKIKALLVMFLCAVFCTCTIAEDHFRIHNAAMSPNKPIDLWLQTINGKQCFSLNGTLSGYWRIGDLSINRQQIMNADPLFSAPTEVKYELYLKESADPNSKDILALTFARAVEFTRFYEATGYKVTGYVIDSEGKATQKELDFTSKSPDGVTITAPRKQ